MDEQPYKTMIELNLLKLKKKKGKDEKFYCYFCCCFHYDQFLLNTFLDPPQANEYFTNHYRKKYYKNKNKELLIYHPECTLIFLRSTILLE